MLSHDEAQDAQKSIVDAHEYEETRESRRNAHIQDTINVQTQKQPFNCVYLSSEECQQASVFTRVFLTAEK